MEDWAVICKGGGGGRKTRSEMMLFYCCFSVSLLVVFDVRSLKNHTVKPVIAADLAPAWLIVLFSCFLFVARNQRDRTLMAGCG